MEIGLQDEFHTYSGGLGILAGDAVKSCADLKVPLVGISLVNKMGYFRQEFTKDGWQIEHPDEWDPSKFMTLLPEEVDVQIQNRDVKVKAWLYEVKSFTGGVVPVLFLDTDVEKNTQEDRDITCYLYGGDERYRLKQEVVLGIGGLRMLDALGFQIRRYHMNEGHSSLLALELLRKNGMNVEKVRNLCIFTTHTPVAAGHDQFGYDLVMEVMGEFIPLGTLKKVAGSDALNMTLLALNLSEFVNGVSVKDQVTSTQMFPGYVINEITNGVHSHTWTCESFRKLYDKYIIGWANEPELLVRVDTIPNEEIWDAHLEAKKKLIDYVNEATKAGMDYDTLTIGFGRRATGYKRATLIFSNEDKLRYIAKQIKMQIVFAGKAHPKDQGGKEMIHDIFNHIEKFKGSIKMAYLPNYDMNVANYMVSGVDVWLNNPLPPYEASGTSGMKAAHNGVINFSVLDGWWGEGWIEGVTGWAIGPHPNEQVSDQESRSRELEDLYSKLEYVIGPTFYDRRDEWITMMKNSIGKIAYYFNTHRMERRYITIAYF
jgi:starch phosphorylase